MKYILQYLLLLLLSTKYIMGVEISPKGFLDSVEGIQIGRSGKLIRSKTRGRLSIETSDDQTTLFLSINAIYNPLINLDHEFILHEAYGEYQGESYDFRVGKQIITWGKADGIRVTDLISPSDLTEFITFEFDDTRIPINAIQFRMLFDQFNIELITIPVFTPAKKAPTDSPWFIKSPLLSTKNTTLIENTPEHNYQSIEFAGKFALFLPEIDLAVSMMYLWDDYPIITTEDQIIHLEYHRDTIIGFETAIPLGDFVIRSEIAYYLQKNFQKKDFTGGTQHQMIHWLIGFDWSPGNNWSIMAQCSQRSILSNSTKLLENQHRWIATLNIQKKILRETLTISNMFYLELDSPDGMNRFTIDYALTDPFHILGGSDYLFGTSGYFAQFKKNTQIWIKIKYSF